MAQVVYRNAADDAGLQGSLFEGQKFWLSATVPTGPTIRGYIRSNGGEVVVRESDADILLVDHLKNVRPTGCLSYRYVEDSARNGRLENKEDHRVGARTAATSNNIHSSSSVQPMVRHMKATRTPFTREDDQELINWVSSVQQKGGGTAGNEIFKQLANQNPRHTWQSWRDRWVKRYRGRDIPGIPATSSAVEFASTQVRSSVEPPPASLSSRQSNEQRVTTRPTGTTRTTSTTSRQHDTHTQPTRASRPPEPTLSRDARQSVTPRASTPEQEHENWQERQEEVDRRDVRNKHKRWSFKRSEEVAPATLSKTSQHAYNLPQRARQPQVYDQEQEDESQQEYHDYQEYSDYLEDVIPEDIRGESEAQLSEFEEVERIDGMDFTQEDIEFLLSYGEELYGVSSEEQTQAFEIIAGIAPHHLGHEWQTWWNEEGREKWLANKVAEQNAVQESGDDTEQESEPDSLLEATTPKARKSPSYHLESPHISGQHDTRVTTRRNFEVLEAEGNEHEGSMVVHGNNPPRRSTRRTKTSQAYPSRKRSERENTVPESSPARSDEQIKKRLKSTLVSLGVLNEDTPTNEGIMESDEEDDFEVPDSNVSQIRPSPTLSATDLTQKNADAQLFGEFASSIRHSRNNKEKDEGTSETIQDNFHTSKQDIERDKNDADFVPADDSESEDDNFQTAKQDVMIHNGDDDLLEPEAEVDERDEFEVMETVPQSVQPRDHRQPPAHEHRLNGLENFRTYYERQGIAWITLEVALESTCLNYALAETALAELVATQTLPSGVRGIWTGKDDESLERGHLMQITNKHGSDGVKKRKKFLDDLKD